MNIGKMGLPDPRNWVYLSGDRTMGGAAHRRYWDHREGSDSDGNDSESNKKKLPSFSSSSSVLCVSLTEPNHKWLIKKPGKCCFLDPFRIEEQWVMCMRASKQMTSRYYCFNYLASILILQYNHNLILLCNSMQLSCMLLSPMHTLIKARVA